MADEKPDVESEQPQQEKPRKGKKKLLIIIAGVILAVAASGFITYTMLTKGKGGSEEGGKKKDAQLEKAVLVAVDPFIVNLAEPGRFLKVTMQFELSDASYQQIITDKIPQIKDAIIILISSKSAESLASPEGKLQLKDELLMRTNQVNGKDVIKNLYFTEFVMQ
jgi:flagellar FliL protein